MYLPDLTKNGTLQSISKVYGRDGKTIFWQEDEKCGGFTVSTKDCYLRTSEMDLITFTPS